MKRLLKQAVAMLLALCSLLALLIPAVSAETSAVLEPETLLNGVIYNEFGYNFYYGLGEVSGHDYLYVPFDQMLYVFDLDTWEKVDEQVMAFGTSLGAFVDSSGIVWVYGAKKTLYRYDPVAKEGKLFTLPASKIGFTMVYSPIEVNGKIYFGTYGAPGGAHILEFDPATGVSTDLGKLVEDAMQCTALTYHNGYIYATAQAQKAGNAPQYVVKFDLFTKKVVDKISILGKPNTSSFDEIQIVGDILFAGSAYQRSMLAIDISGETMGFATFDNVPNTGIEGCISEEVDGKVYFFTWNNRKKEPKWTYYNDFYSYDIQSKTFTKLNTYDPVNSKILCQKKNIVTIKNDTLGLDGKYIFTMVGANITLYGFDGTPYKMPVLPDIDEQGIANRLTSFTKGPDGTNTIYMGSFMNNIAAAYNIITGKVTLQETYSFQVSQNFFHDGKWYVTNYGACSLSEVTLGNSDHTGTVTTLYALNEGVNTNYFSQERMQNFTAGDNKVFTSTVPHKSEYGGFIAWYDYDKKATFVAVENDLVLYAKDGAQTTWYNAKTDEPYTFTCDFEGLVAGQMVKTLVYQDGYIYASTTAFGGSNTVQKDGVTAQLIVYDPVKMEMVATYDIREGIEGLASDIAAITGIVADPNVTGKFWGLVSGTLFFFTFDRDTKTFQVQEVLSHSKANSMGTSPAVWSPWKCYFDDGFLYYYSKENKSVMMVSTEDSTYYAALPADTGPRFVLGDDDMLYFLHETKVLRYNTAGMIAKIKADKPGADLEAADKAAAAAVQAQIDAVGTVTLESEVAIKAARAAYDALTDTQKDLVNAEALVTAESKLAELQKEQVPGSNHASAVLFAVLAVGVSVFVIAAFVFAYIKKKRNNG